MGTPSTTIHRVKLITGFLEKKNDKSNCDAISFEGDTIPEDIIEVFRKDVENGTLILRERDVDSENNLI